MSNYNHRVLGRMGAHELTEDQIQNVTGGLLTVPSVIITGPPSHPDVQHDQ